MIRDKKEIEEYNDSEFYKAILPSEKKIRDYCKNHLIYDYFTYVIWTLYKENAIWNNYTLEGLYKQALENLINDIPKYKDLKLNRIETLLEQKYYIRIKNKNPIKIEELKI